MDFEQAKNILKEFKGDSYLSGFGAIHNLDKILKKSWKKAVLIRGTFVRSDEYVEIIKQTLSKSKIELVREIKGSRPNSPKEDLFRITEQINEAKPDVIISFGGGSTIDAVKAAIVLHSLGGNIEDYFGSSLVTKSLNEAKRTLLSHIAIQSIAGSASHLTKYANITDLSTSQKKLIVDDAIIPAFPVFDYEITKTSPASLTIDGAMDGLSHCLEVLYGSVDKEYYEKMQRVTGICLKLVLEYLPVALDNPESSDAREALCLATDLGGYAIMTGGTNGGHLSSFSLVDILSHGRACAIMNPYYTVFFAPAIEKPLKYIAEIYKQAGLIHEDIDNISARILAEIVANAMFKFAQRIDMPTKLKQIQAFSSEHIERAIKAAKNPQLKMKLQNMPVSLTSETVEQYMRPVLQAASDGDISKIRNISN